MKGDFTRNTFKKNSAERFSSVRMQQGRVQLDADWNEQVDITAQRAETGAQDMIGECGAPVNGGAFAIISTQAALAAKYPNFLKAFNLNSLPAGDFVLEPGRFYAGGKLVELDEPALYSQQPYQPKLPAISAKGEYLAYLDVWERHMTYLEDPAIRETALGGPDTASRTRTTWQVNLLSMPAKSNCLTSFQAWDDLLAGSTGQMRARAVPGSSASGPCAVPSSAGYRGLQNQLYRVEIHQGDVLGKATFKWSRENGSLLFGVVQFIGPQPTTKLKLSSLGKDRDLALHKGDWVEVLDENMEMSFQPGFLVQITDLDPDEMIITLSQAVSGLQLATTRVRRWDSNGALVAKVPANANDFIALEEGVEVHFEPGSYHTGDYWLIPARTILGNPLLVQTGGIDWPTDKNGPLALPPEGIHHSYCRLGVINFDGSAIKSVEDCRRLFPALTELVQLAYAGGDGQEGLPGQKLDQPLQASVSNGEHPVEGARVQFKIEQGSGSLKAGASTGAQVVALTDSSGLANCAWTLDASNPDQRVKATLLDVADNALHTPIFYSANLSIASQVAYDPSKCINMPGATTVQAALDELCANAALYYVGGDGQAGQTGQTLPGRLEVRLANGHLPLSGELITFSLVKAGDGSLTTPGQSGDAVNVATDANGYASCQWALGKASNQQVVAFWPKFKPLEVHFNASLAAGLPTQPVIQIENVILSTSGAQLPANTNIPASVLAGGLTVICDHDLDPLSMENQPSMNLWLYLPFPLSPTDIQIWGAPGSIGANPTILLAKTDVQGNNALWQPAASAQAFLTQRLFQLLVQAGLKRAVPACLEINGNLVWDGSGQIYLDGDNFGAPGQPPDWKRPSGNGQPGGRFALWFNVIAG